MQDEATPPADAPAEAPGHQIARSTGQIYRQVRDAVTALAHEVDQVKRSAGFTAALDAMSQFWAYSPFNQWLIRMQLPDATHVAGRRAWERLGRKTKLSARPILIVAPAATLRPPFVAVPVFDVSQTRGRRLPSVDMALRGPSAAAQGLERAAATLGVRVERFDGRPGLQGFSTGGTIHLRRHMPGRQRAATIAHELAHEILHTMRSRGDTTHAQVETEADATSYIVMRSLGLQSKAPAYIAWHGGSGALVLRSLKRVQRAARRILRACALSATLSHRACRASQSRKSRARTAPWTGVVPARLESQRLPTEGRR